MTSMVAEQAGQIRCLRALCASRRGKQLAATCKGCFPSAVGEQAEMADADQAFRQHVKKKYAQELIC